MIAAIVPAAGRSSRMGRSKPLLEIAGEPLIVRVVQALRNGGATPIVVVCPPTSDPSSFEVFRLATEAGARCLLPHVATRDMRSSFVVGLDSLEAMPSAPAGVLLAPVDSPGITTNVVHALIEIFDADAVDFAVPVFAGKRGHPLLMAWGKAREVRTLPPDQGINALLRRPQARVREVAAASAEVLLDLDTPDDYRRWAADPANTRPNSEQA